MAKVVKLCQRLTCESVITPLFPSRLKRKKKTGAGTRNSGTQGLRVQSDGAARLAGAQEPNRLRP